MLVAMLNVNLTLLISTAILTLLTSVVKTKIIFRQSFMKSIT